MNGERHLVRVYLMAYSPPGWDMDKVQASGGVERIMKKADVCFTVGEGEPWPLGVAIIPDVDFKPELGGPNFLKLGHSYRCVRHEYDGKIAVVEHLETKVTE